MGGLPKSLERTICLALIQMGGSYDPPCPRHPPVMQAFPITSHRLRPAWPQAQTSSTHAHTPAQPDVLCMYEYLRSESKIPNHSTYSIFATLKDNGPFEMMTTMPSRQTTSCVRWGCIAWDGIYDYACMGLDQKVIPQGSALGVLGITVVSILVDDFLAFGLCIATRL
jgi:hypothetical protein